MNRAKTYFDEAVAKAPKFAPAYSGLADTYAPLGDWQFGVMTSRVAFPILAEYDNRRDGGREAFSVGGFTFQLLSTLYWWNGPLLPMPHRQESPFHQSSVIGGRDRPDPRDWRH